MNKLGNDPIILAELAVKINNILLYGDPEIRTLIPDLIREFHNQVLSDPKALVALKTHSNSQLNRKTLQDSCISNGEPFPILHQMGKHFSRKAKSKTSGRIPREKGKILKMPEDKNLTDLPKKTNLREHFDSLKFPEKQFLDKMEELISFIDRDLKYKFNNTSYEKWFGSKIDSLYDTKVKNLIGSHFKKLKPFFEQALDGEIVEIISPVYYKGTEGRLVHSSYFPFYGENDTVEGFFAVVKGVTNQSDSYIPKIELLNPPFEKP